jgi:hypothetical protein
MVYFSGANEHPFCQAVINNSKSKIKCSLEALIKGENHSLYSQKGSTVIPVTTNVIISCNHNNLLPQLEDILYMAVRTHHNNFSMDTGTKFRLNSSNHCKNMGVVEGTVQVYRKPSN